MRAGGGEDKSKNRRWLTSRFASISRLNFAAVPKPLMVHFAGTVNLNYPTGAAYEEYSAAQTRSRAAASQMLHNRTRYTS